jgi:hypothetical protein
MAKPEFQSIGSGWERLLPFDMDDICGWPKYLTYLEEFYSVNRNHAASVASIASQVTTLVLGLVSCFCNVWHRVDLSSCTYKFALDFDTIICGKKQDMVLRYIGDFDTMAMFGWYRLVLVVVVVFNTSKLTHKKLTPWMFGWRC